ncbi:MAG: hypothetical protein ABEI74_01000 [Candidatus Pacearchaeota archaeon]
MKKRAQLNMSFGWIFALIAGAVILFLTIYGISSFMDVSQQQQTSAQAQDLQILLNPLQTSFSSAVSSYIERNTPTRIHNRCSVYGDFGDQIISISEESVDGWTDRGVPSRFENKYIFSNSTVQGETFYIFSKPFNFPYKVADLVYLTSANKKYCFKSPPEGIKKELNKLNQPNLVVGCSGSNKNSIGVCFSGGGSGCDVSVDYSKEVDVSSGIVSKNGKEMHFYSDALMYAAVFSDEDTYECQLGRLFKRSQNLASVYLNKYSYMDQNACSNDFRGDLSGLNSSLGFRVPEDPDKLKISDDYLDSDSGGSQLTATVETLRKANDNSFCSLW